MKLKVICILIASIALISCATKSKSIIMFPQADELFITSGDGNIQKPYTPVGEFIFVKNGWRFPLPILGLLAIADIDPDIVLKEDVYKELKAMGGDQVIQTKINWTPPNSGFLGFNASGGSVVLTGTVVKK